MTKVETSLAALATLMLNTFGDGDAGGKFFRDPEEPPSESVDGIAIMRNGDPGEPLVTLSPIHYQWEHFVPLEFNAVGEDRNTVVDGMLLQLDAALIANRSLSGIVLDARVMTAPMIDEMDQGEGAQTVRNAQVMVRLEYDSNSPTG